MDNNREKNILDTNRSMHPSGSNPPSHNFMSMEPFTLYDNHQVEEIEKFCFMHQPEKNSENFWKERKAEMRNAPSDVRGQHLLPLARIKKVMKSDGQVKMIIVDTPVIFAKACEMFIMELSQRAWMITQNNKRRTLQRGDIAKAIREENLLNFLHDIVPMETQQEPHVGTVNQPGMHVSLPEINVTQSYPIYAEVPPTGHQEAIDQRFPYSMNLHNLNSAFLVENQGIVPGSSSFPPPPPPSSFGESDFDNNFKWESTERHRKRLD